MSHLSAYIDLGHVQPRVIPTSGLQLLNVIEGFFGKMGRQMLGGVRVGSKQQLAGRIGLYLDEVNANPVPYR